VAEEPDLIISVHPILQCIPLASFMPSKPPRPIPFLTCVTDLGDGHPWWFNPAADRLFVPTEDMKKQALACGVVQDRIDVIGLPLRKGFWNVDSSAANKKRTREMLRVGIPTGGGGGHGERKVVLLMGGGDGIGKLEQVTRTLPAQLALADYKSHLVIVCGRNTKVPHLDFSHSQELDTYQI
jgi:1,2-diacylglycerol 3-beta-galactosyltransferase